MQNRINEKRKLVATAFFISGCLMFTSACSNGGIDYDMDTSEGTGIGMTGNSSVEQFQDIPRWRENLDLERSDGTVVPLLIDTSITLPDTEGMAIVEVQKVTMDAAYKEQFAKSIFGDSQIYSTKSVDFTGLSDDYSQVTNYEADYYKGNMDGGTYCLIFDTGNILENINSLNEAEFCLWDETHTHFYSGESSNIYLYAADESVRPQKIASGALYREIYPDSGDYFHQISKAEKEASNVCTFTEEEAKARVETFLAEIGFADSVYLECKDAYWQEYEPNDNVYERNAVQNIKDGYVFTYEQEWESFVFAGEIRMNEEIQITQISVSINDTGILKMIIKNPFNMISITEDVGLLPFETIQGIVKNELSENADSYYSWWSEDYGTQYYQKMELRQYCIEDPSRRGYFSFIPVWKLSHLRYEVPNVVVNAMDGTILSAMGEGPLVREDDENLQD